ncbi:MAG: antibiotic biosynthesis monooxygenase [Gloeomargaritaceae cyanobacterium C42_A2020_066]|nr:antibiotic biosynthesis monooxygenase [Gloeomargaritaceae cyanobacterium C42_A2020_066]
MTYLNPRLAGIDLLALGCYTTYSCCKYLILKVKDLDSYAVTRRITPSSAINYDSFKYTFMITLNVLVRVKPEAREELIQIGQKLFDDLAKEPTFVDARLSTSEDESDLVVVYERWNETKESFIQNILPKPFYNPYLALLDRVGISREIHWINERQIWNSENL